MKFADFMTMLPIRSPGDQVFFEIFEFLGFLTKKEIRARSVDHGIDFDLDGREKMVSLMNITFDLHNVVEE